jgi:nitric oxide reductase NorQ protein
MVADHTRGTVLEPRPLPNFVETPNIRRVVDRARAYVGSGFPVHLRGAAGTGKTTLAMHVAATLGRPVVMIHGDEETSTSDLVGGEHGYWTRRVVDNFIHSVVKAEEEVSVKWVDNRLTVAAKHGFTLIYDEFTRSRPEANNVLLSVLQERMLDLPGVGGGEDSYLRVHPGFSCIFTSNPGEYAGVYRSQDALMDRMVTIDLGCFDEPGEVAITSARSGVGAADATRIVRLVRGLRGSGTCAIAPTVRSCIKIARATTALGASVSARDDRFLEVCGDVLVSGCTRGADEDLARIRQALERLVREIDWKANGVARVAVGRGRRPA